MQIAIITHPQDRRLRTWFDGRMQVSAANYQIDHVLLAGRDLGLRWFFTDPTQPFRPADAALLHVDMSLIPQDYLDLAARYPRTLNGQVSDIRKQRVSRNLLDAQSDWHGPVMVKSDLNSNGGPERFLAAKLARISGATPPDEEAPPQYQLFDRLAAVPETVWQDPRLVVERYLPEKRGDNNVLRVWNFLGAYERCSWYVSPETIVKGGNIVAFGLSEVPDLLREERKRLGFDYGKFDFAIGPDGPVLYDANRTPASLRARPDLMRAVAAPMAQALIDMAGS
jgi:hypothetical protein